MCMIVIIGWGVFTDDVLLSIHVTWHSADSMVQRHTDFRANLNEALTDAAASETRLKPRGDRMYLVASFENFQMFG
jgi:hypothetical protein